MVANVEEDDIVEVEMPRREILKAFSMSMIGRNSVNTLTTIS